MANFLEGLSVFNRRKFEAITGQQQQQSQACQSKGNKHLLAGQRGVKSFLATLSNCGDVPFSHVVPSPDKKKKKKKLDGPRIQRLGVRS